MASRGRPTKFDAVLLERLAWLLAHGWDRGAAAEDVGIARATFYRWMNDRRTEFDLLREVVGRAEAEAQGAVTMNIVKASERDWRAGLAWLQARYPDDWPSRSVRRSRVSRQNSRN